METSIPNLLDYSGEIVCTSLTLFDKYILEFKRKICWYTFSQKPPDNPRHRPKILWTWVPSQGCQSLSSSHRFSSLPPQAKLFHIPISRLFAPGVILDSVGSLHGATELTGSHDVTTPIIDQITAQQIAGSAMFGTVENMQKGGQERRPAKSSLSQVHLLEICLILPRNCCLISSVQH